MAGSEFLINRDVAVAPDFAFQTLGMPLDRISKLAGAKQGLRCREAVGLLVFNGGRRKRCP